MQRNLNIKLILPYLLKYKNNTNWKVQLLWCKIQVWQYEWRRRAQWRRQWMIKCWKLYWLYVNSFHLLFTLSIRVASSEVHGKALATLWDFDIIYLFISNNALNQTIKILQKQNWISYSSCSFSLKMAYVAAVFISQCTHFMYR